MTGADNPWAAFDGDNVRERQPIGTAPRDGTAIMVGHPDVGEFIMQWGHIARNALFAPGEVGMWIAPNGMHTWVDGEDGPTSWRALA